MPSELLDLARTIALEAGELAAQRRREGVEVADVREGQDPLAALWRELCPGEPIPAKYEFSMS